MSLSKPVNPKVLIIGAGISGLSAAKTLSENGIENVIVVEAQDYIGGRIRSMRFDDGIVELGAQWLHGTENELKQIADENNLLSEVVSHEGTGKFVREDGFAYDEMTVAKVDFTVGEILSRCEDLDNADNNMSVEDYLRKEFSEHVEVIDKDKATIWRQLFEWHLKFQAIDNSCATMNDLSAARWGDYDFNGDECQSHINYKHGYCTLVNAILLTIPNIKVKLNKPVENVTWQEQELDGKVRVTCHDGTIYDVDHVICTVSLGVLKKNHQKMFTPALPEKLITAITGLGFGNVGKIFLQFEHSWWGNSEGFQIVRECDEKEYVWYQDISGFDVVNVGTPNTLVGWIGGKGSMIMETLSDEEIGTQCVKLLESATKYNLPKLKSVRRSRWYSNPFTQGAYSHITVQCNTLNIVPASLHQPVTVEGKPVLLFAGEACHHSHFSTTHGAFESGQHQALYLLEYINNCGQG